MSYFRTYINNQATLISSNYTNNSKNPVLEIVRSKDQHSRYIFSFDLTRLREKINQIGYISGSVETHTVNFYNCIRYREELIGATTVDGYYRDNNVDIQLFTFDETFAKGIGYDYNYTTGTTFVTSDVSQYVPNWYYRDKVNQWSENGVYSGTSSNVLATYSILEGNENISFDVTNKIQDVLFNTTANTVNFGISYTSQFEQTLSGDSKYISSFFSKTTNSFYEPFLQTKVNDIITDNRESFYLDETNQLYLYLSKEVDSVNSVTILDYEDQLYITLTGNSITKVNNKIYKIDVTILSDEYPDLVNFEDMWNVTVNGVTKDIIQQFTLLTDSLSLQQENAYENSDYYFTVSGILQGEKISQSNKSRTLQVKTKILYNSSIENETPIDFIDYRLFVLEGNNEVEIFPFTNVNKTYYNNYFTIDIESLVPQVYYIDLRLNRNGIILPYTKKISFEVLSEI